MFHKEESPRQFSMATPHNPFLFKQLTLPLLKLLPPASRATKKLRETLTREQPSHSLVTLNNTLGMCLNNALPTVKTSMNAVLLIGTSTNTLATLVLTANASPLTPMTEQDLTPTAIATAKETNAPRTTRLTTLMRILRTESPDRSRKPLQISFLILSTDASPAAYTTASTGNTTTNDRSTPC